MNIALLIVDVQNDFCPGGALSVSEGDMVVPVLNSLIAKAKSEGLLTIATRDWHPEDTKHFKQYGGQWPVHCVSDTRGSEFHPSLKLPQDVVIISKGTDPNEDGYSAFDGKDEKGTPLGDALKKHDVKTLWVGGLATDYCVRASVLDALKLDYEVFVITDAIRGVDVNEGDSQKALGAMEAAGAKLIRSDDVL